MGPKHSQHRFEVRSRYAIPLYQPVGISSFHCILHWNLRYWGYYPFIDPEPYVNPMSYITRKKSAPKVHPTLICARSGTSLAAGPCNPAVLTTRTSSYLDLDLYIYIYTSLPLPPPLPLSLSLSLSLSRGFQRIHLFEQVITV